MQRVRPRQSAQLREEQTGGGAVKFYFRASDKFFTLFDVLLVLLTGLAWLWWGNSTLTWQRFSAGLSLLLSVLMLLRLLYRWNCAQEESLLVLPGVGLQVERRTYSGAQTTRFVERQVIRAVMVNEGIQGFKAYYYIVIMLNTERRLVLPFERFVGKAEELFRVWKLANELLQLNGR